MNNKEIEDIKPEEEIEDINPEEVNTGIQRLYEEHKKESLIAGLIGTGLVGVIGTIFLLKLFKEKRRDLAREADKVDAELGDGIAPSLKNLAVIPLANHMEAIAEDSGGKDFLDALNRFSQKVAQALGFPPGESFKENVVIASSAIGAAIKYLLDPEKEE